MIETLLISGVRKRFGLWVPSKFNVPQEFAINLPEFNTWIYFWVVYIEIIIKTNSLLFMTTKRPSSHPNLVNIILITLYINYRWPTTFLTSILVVYSYIKIYVISINSWNIILSSMILKNCNWNCILLIKKKKTQI